jgi:hypothetical protein
MLDRWDGPTTTRAAAGNLESVVEDMRRPGNHVGLVVVANKYDGIDLPQDACRILVIDGLPQAFSGDERLDSLMQTSIGGVDDRQVQRIEQGMGRGVRSSEDYCAVFLLGRRLAQLTDAMLSFDDLRSLTARVLSEADFQPEGKDRRVLDEIVRAATHRLVLIAPKPDDSGMGFDVRSIQELMAGLYLVSATPTRVNRYLRTTAPSPHWRSTWIFAAGALFKSSQEHLRIDLVGLVEHIDDDASARMGRVVPIGPRLASDLIEDGMANSYPRHQKALASVALRVLLEPATKELPWIARTLVKFASLGADQQHLVAEGIRDALVTTSVSRDTVGAVLEHFRIIFDDLDSDIRTRGLAAVKPRPGAALAEEYVDWESFDEEIATAPVSNVDLLAATAQSIKVVSTGARLDNIAASDILSAGLADLEIAAIVEIALVALGRFPYIFRDGSENITWM